MVIYLDGLFLMHQDPKELMNLFIEVCQLLNDLGFIIKNSKREHGAYSRKNDAYFKTLRRPLHYCKLQKQKIKSIHTYDILARSQHITLTSGDMEGLRSSGYRLDRR